MHDGYVYTLAICGSATASSPAPAVLNAMLDAIPPVKRAALLGEVVPLTRNGKLDESLIDSVIADMHDAEILFFITPIYHTNRHDVRLMLPERLQTLLQRATPLAASGALQDRLAVLVVVDSAPAVPPPDTAHRGDDLPPVDKVTDSVIARIVYRQSLFATLQRFCVQAGMHIVGATIIQRQTDAAEQSGLSAEDMQLVSSLAQHAYLQARKVLPDALPDALPEML
jgi:hypothetical protein